MKQITRIFILGILTFICYNTINSQPSVGFQTGVNIATLHGHKDYDESKPRFGLTANLVLDIPLDRNGFLSLETGLGVTQLGMRHQRITQDIAQKTTTDVKNKLDYVTMPLYLKENFSSAYAKFGVYGAYLLNVKSELETVIEQSGQVQPKQISSNEVFEKNANKYDYGLSFGIGAIKHLNSRKFRKRRGRRVLPVLQIDFKYNIGLASIDAAGDTPDMNFKNRVFMIAVTLTTVPNK